MRYILFLVVLLWGVCLAAQEDVMLEVTGFTDGSAMQAAGAQVGEVILMYDGARVTSLEQLGKLREKAKGTVSVLVRRGDGQLSLSVPAGVLGVYLRTLAPDHKRTADAVVIEGIGRLGWDLKMESTYMGCVYRVDERFGRGLSYGDILGLSGYAFRLQVHTTLCPSSPDAPCGRDVGGEVLRTLGYSFVPCHLDEAEPDIEEGSCSQVELEDNIRASLNAGWPVIAIDMIEIPEWGIIAGYQKGGEELFCRTYFDRTSGYELARKFPWALYCLTGYQQADLTAAWRGSLVKAREMLETERYDEYYSGLAAYEHWIALLEGVRQDDVKEQAFAEAMHANWWIYFSLMEARGFAAPYIRAHAGELGLSPEEAEKLAALYDAQMETLQAGYGNVPAEMIGNEIADWTQQARAGQVETLRRLMALEQEVLAILKKV